MVLVPKIVDMEILFASCLESTQKAETHIYTCIKLIGECGGFALRVEVVVACLYTETCVSIVKGTLNLAHVLS